ncbi:uncharacterized protein EDB93DRAFT_1274012 [Suillus bovinus]|uniref:uncharacterized protein n=1 Tax=Suillus bovinus TaxID=48563 RepID=UPI001B8709E7|nr:uncharacterized protein EDB93DRAFT_1274012 [Suillus bovinus]KAG2151603.1 hypothetical protein EDB93DRAFT_1274012 [Suillus bovinus]
MSSRSNLRSRARGGLSTIFDYFRTRRPQGSSATLPTSYPLSALPQTVPHITVSSPASGGSLTPPATPLPPVPSASATSVATASGVCPAPSNTNPSSSGISALSFTTSPSTASTRKARPIPASDVNRYERKRTIPQTKDRVLIEPGNKVFEEYVLFPQLEYRELTTPSTPPSSRWAPLVHPEGALYYYDSARRIYTDADLSKPSTLHAIEAFADQLYNDAQTNSNIDITSKTELVIEDIDENTCGYYFVEQDTRCIFWLERFDAETLFENIRRVRNMGHIKYAIEAQYCYSCGFDTTQTTSRTHCELFPHENRVTPVALEELKQMIMHAAAVTITSVTCVAPFEKDELEKMLDLVMNIEGTLDGQFAHTRCVVARFMSEFSAQSKTLLAFANITVVKAKFFNFCGQPGARLDSDQTIYFKDHDHRSLLFIVASFLLFGVPRTHQADLKMIWVDRIINRVLWDQFIDKLNDEWTGLALSATVILNANIAFLAIPSVQDTAGLLSYMSVVCSIAVVLLVLLLVRQNQKRDCERAVSLLTYVEQSFFGTEALAITYSLPYGLLMWALLYFAAGFGNLVFKTESQWTRGAAGFAGSLVVCLVALVLQIGRHQINPKDEESMV